MLPLPDIVGDIGTGVAACLMAAQLPACYIVITKTKSVAHMSVVPTVGQAANFIAWTAYGLVAKEQQVLQVNAIGVGFSVVYGAIFLIYARGKHWWTLLATLCATLAILAGTFAAIIIPGAIDHDAKVQALGYVAVVGNVIM